MRREPTLLFRCTGMEKEKNAFSYAEKYVAARYVTDLLKAEKRGVKPTWRFESPLGNRSNPKWPSMIWKITWS
jgi:hypothetical protein